MLSEGKKKDEVYAKKANLFHFGKGGFHFGRAYAIYEPHRHSSYSVSVKSMSKKIP